MKLTPSAATSSSPAGPQEDIDEQAALWVARRQGDDLSASEEARFQAWVTADPAHRSAFDAMALTAAQVRSLPAATLSALRAGSSGVSVPHRSAQAWHRTRSWWPQATAAALVLTLAVGGWDAWMHKPMQPGASQAYFQQTYTTQRGQLLSVSLPDGSGIQLDTDTRVVVALHRDRREVRLLNGQAFFNVAAKTPASDDDRTHAERVPFAVSAAGLRVTVIGTRFSVRSTASGLDAGAVGLSVEEGRVRLAADDAPANGKSPAALDLTAGQRIVASADRPWGKVLTATPENAAPWRTGRVSFENTPLDQAIAEFERYGPTHLVVKDPRVAALRIGGSFDLRKLDRFVAALPQALPVRLLVRDGITEIVSAR